MMVTARSDLQTMIEQLPVSQESAVSHCEKSTVRGCVSSYVSTGVVAICIACVQLGHWPPTCAALMKALRRARRHSAKIAREGARAAIDAD